MDIKEENINDIDVMLSVGQEEKIERFLFKNGFEKLKSHKEYGGIESDVFYIRECDEKPLHVLFCFGTPVVLSVDEIIVKKIKRGTKIDLSQVIEHLQSKLSEYEETALEEVE